MTTEQRELAQREYQAGKAAFERGDYRQAVASLERANALVAPGTKLSGEMQIWLVTAYEAAGQRTEALNLCRKASKHPDLDTRKQARRLLYILEAPRLKSRPEWLTEIPDLATIEQNTSDREFGRSKFAPTSPPKRIQQKTPIIPEAVDLSQVNTKDNAFVWVALVAGMAIVAGLVWLS